MPARLITPAGDEPVTLDEAKDQLRLETSLDDTQVEGLMRAAREYVEQVCWRGLLQQTWELVLNGFHGEDARELPAWSRPHFSFCQPIKLPMGQLATLEDDDPAVISVKYIDQTGVERTLDPAEYTVDNVSVPGRILPAYSKSWPATRDQWDAVRVQYVVGWADGDTVPGALKQAILMLISQMYEHRTPEVTGAIIAKVQFSFDSLLAPYRINQVG